MAERILIQGGIMCSMVDGEEPEEGNLYIHGDRLIAGRGHGTPFLEHEADHVIDARGCIVMPGLINAHTHTPMTFMRSTMDGLGFPGPDSPSAFPPGQDWRSHMTDDDAALSTRLAQAEMIRSGTTTFIDMYRRMEIVADAVVESGLRAALGETISDYRQDPDEWLPYDEEVARESYEASAEFAAAWNGRGEGRVMTLIAPHETSTCREPWLSRTAKLAEQLGMTITIHVAESQHEVAYAKERYGCTPVQALHTAGILEHRVIGAHSIYLTEEDIDLLAGARYSAASCPQSYLKLAIDLTPVPKLLAAGVNVALGTDSALTNNNLNLWEEIYLTASLHGFLAKDPSIIPPEAVIKMANQGGARALGLEHELGTLEVGKKADVIVLDENMPSLHPLQGVLINNLVYAASGHEVRDVIVNGRMLMRDRQLMTLDEAEIIRQAELCVRRLRRQVGLPTRFTRH